MSYGPSRKALGTALSIAGLIILVLMFVRAYNDDRLAVAVSQWPVTNGVISNVSANQIGRLPLMVNINYRYVISGHSYQSNKVRIGNSTPADFSTYSDGKSVGVHFNPTNPVEAYLEPAINAGDRFEGLLLSAGLILIGLSFLYLGFKSPTLAF